VDGGLVGNEFNLFAPTRTGTRDGNGLPEQGNPQSLRRWMGCGATA